MRIVSLVPSWTETLIECGLKVVGRTRFCIHPKQKLSQVAVVGGTKDCDWEKIKALKPDLLLLDQEENPKWMAEQSPIEYHATHIQNIHNVPVELSKLAARLRNQPLHNLADRWQKITESNFSRSNFNSLPGVVRWIHPPSNQTEFVYVIWKDPWMAAGKATFIGSIFEHLGFRGNYFVDQKYPQFDLEMVTQDTVLLFSSEPYPFEKRPPQPRGQQPMALVNGESYSWFGLRSLCFLEDILAQGPKSQIQK